jgi:hypothetical protein
MNNAPWFYPVPDKSPTLENLTEMRRYIEAEEERIKNRVKEEVEKSKKPKDKPSVDPIKISLVLLGLTPIVAFGASIGYLYMLIQLVDQLKGLLK